MASLPPVNISDKKIQALLDSLDASTQANALALPVDAAGQPIPPDQVSTMMGKSSTTPNPADIDAVKLGNTTVTGPNGQSAYTNGSPATVAQPAPAVQAFNPPSQNPSTPKMKAAQAFNSQNPSTPMPQTNAQYQQMPAVGTSPMDTSLQPNGDQAPLLQGGNGPVVPGVSGQILSTPTNLQTPPPPIGDNTNPPNGPSVLSQRLHNFAVNGIAQSSQAPLGDLLENLLAGQSIYPSVNAGNGGSSRSPYATAIASGEAKLQQYNQMALSSPQMAAIYKPYIDSIQEGLKNDYALNESWIKNEGNAGTAVNGSPEKQDIETAGQESVKLHGAQSILTAAIASGDPQKLIAAANSINEDQKLMVGIRRLGGEDAANAIETIAENGTIPIPWLDKATGVLVPSKVKGSLQGMFEVSQNNDRQYDTLMKQNKIWDPTAGYHDAQTAYTYNPDYFTYDPKAANDAFNVALEKGLPLLSQNAQDQAAKTAELSGKYTGAQTKANNIGLKNGFLPSTENPTPPAATSDKIIALQQQANDPSNPYYQSSRDYLDKHGIKY